MWNGERTVIRPNKNSHGAWDKVVFDVPISVLDVPISSRLTCVIYCNPGQSRFLRESFASNDIC